MTDDDAVLRMTLPELLAFVQTLEDKYTNWSFTPLALIDQKTTITHSVTMADMARLRESLRQCVAELDRLLVEWDTVMARGNAGV